MVGGCRFIILSRRECVYHMQGWKHLFALDVGLMPPRYRLMRGQRRKGSDADASRNQKDVMLR